MWEDGWAFKAILTLLVLALASRWWAGAGQKGAPTFVALVLGAMVAYEYYYVWQAALKAPSYGDRVLYRWDCLDSTKGGGRPRGDYSDKYLNPCYCRGDEFLVTCRNIMTSERKRSWEICPVGADWECTLPARNDKRVYPYISEKRDCSRGQGQYCTEKEPCTPCEVDLWSQWIKQNDLVPRCVACGPGVPEDCDFQPGIGPYCKESPDSAEVVPCRKCCTDSSVLITHRDACY